MVEGRKIYVEKAVQTISFGSSSNSSLHHAQGLQEPIADNYDVLKVSNANDERASVDGAYTNSPAPTKDAKSSPASRRMRKPSQIPYSHPSQVIGQAKRIVSLPEAVASKSMSSGLSAPIEPSLRAVSLPGLNLSDPSLELACELVQNNSSSLEYLDTSFDTSYRSSQTGSAQHNVRSFPPSDMPTTPSPPSSPESILVIGNDARISRTVLRQCRLSSTKTSDAEDEAGWITWARTPPRPIPALHGPLSLPYARCPSGAEGTIIEDADLPRIIWGLDEDIQVNPDYDAPVAKALLLETEVDSASVQYDPASKHPQIQKHLDHGHGTALLHEREIKHEEKLTELRPLTFSQDSKYQKTPNMSTEKPQLLWDDSPINIHQLDSYGKRVAWLRPPRLKKTSELKPTAPAFVPSLPQCSTPVTSRIFIEPRAGSQITAERRLSAMEIAQRFHNERRQQETPVSVLPVPMPAWSPSLSFPSSLPSSDPGLFHSHHIREPVPSLTSRPNARSGRDLPQELRQIDLAQRELNIINLSSVQYADTNLSFGANTQALVSSSQDSFPRPSSTINIFRRLPSALYVDSNAPSIDPQSQSPGLSQPQARILQAPRPQSIPMARLIQRRLSSVAEEDSFNATNSSPVQSQSVRRFTNNSSEICGNVTSLDMGKKKVSIMSEETGIDYENKENASRHREPNVEKGTRKKWRPRKRTTAPNVQQDNKRD